ncbi:hypothetical protein BDA96_03G117300 [Sorghum bicolor]|uniref:Glabrous enhancer-binding protein-like DBD domain-containing protein n=2 Tax=Sorghum bicolor TaxID=4558 RepID=A0A921RDG5_SORBI|nr:probable transcription factor At3g04930 [Sorghum bicolor]EES02686.1 hypothetical protein SORBI_3003G112700 [Sorghum bicolor]KAG0537082.1 hypothetical protein BDA96_03G117300 [Sorghum bicolor]|eukprot:XP_002457566.1 probable transcription factor At3g04930 [Sorghum bicolor]
MADDHPHDAAASSSAGGDEDDEGTDTDASNSDLANPQGQDPLPFPDAASVPPHPHPLAPAPEPAGAVPPPQPQPHGPSADDSRRLFQRLWTDEEELLILRGFLDFTARRGTTFASHQYDTGPFYEEIRRRLSFDFTKSQLIEKLRRLKKKYRVCAARVAAQGAAFAFRSAHEGAIYDVARHIWRPAFRRGEGGGGSAADASDEDDINPVAAAAMEDGGGGSASTPTARGRGGRRVRRRTAQELEAPALPLPATSALMITDAAEDRLVVAVENLVPAIAPPPPLQVPTVSPAAATPSPMPVSTGGGATEEAIRSIMSPLLKEFISSVTVAGQTGFGLGLGTGFGGIGGFDILGLGLGVAGPNPGMPSDDKWRQQQILELEVYLKRIELVREQVTAALEDLRSSEC